MYVNLLPERLRYGQMVRRRVVQWCLIWFSAALLAGAAAYARTWLPYTAELVRLQTRERQYAQTKRLMDESQQMQTRIKDLESREAMVLELADELPAVTLVGVLSRAGHEAGGQVYVKQMVYKLGGPAPPPRPADAATEKPRPLVTLQGAGLDIVATMRLVAQLRDSRLFDSVVLKSTQTENAGDQAVVSYLLECELKRS